MRGLVVALTVAGGRALGWQHRRSPVVAEKAGTGLVRVDSARDRRRNVGFVSEQQVSGGAMRTAFSSACSSRGEAGARERCHYEWRTLASEDPSC